MKSIAPSQFAGRVLMTGNPNDCIEWVGGIAGKTGYGMCKVDGEQKLVHRVSYEWFKGKIPKDLVIDHLCRNRRCVNPLHLEAVTTKENVLRGIGLTAKNAVKTECDHGHPFTEKNTYLYPDGRRSCRECRRNHDRRYNGFKGRIYNNAGVYL